MDSGFGSQSRTLSAELHSVVSPTNESTGADAPAASTSNGAGNNIPAAKTSHVKTQKAKALANKIVSQAHQVNDEPCVRCERLGKECIASSDAGSRAKACVSCITSKEKCSLACRGGARKLLHDAGNKISNVAGEPCGRCWDEYGEDWRARCRLPKKLSQKFGWSCAGCLEDDKYLTCEHAINYEVEQLRKEDYGMIPAEDWCTNCKFPEDSEGEREWLRNPCLQAKTANQFDRACGNCLRLKRPGCSVSNTEKKRMGQG